MLELMGKSIGYIIETRRAIATRGPWVAVLLRIRIPSWCVVEVALVVYTTRLLSSPDLLLTGGVWERLRKGGRRGGELSTLLGGEVGSVVVAKVQLKTIRVPAVLLLLILSLLLLVRHLGTRLRSVLYGQQE